MMLLTCLSVLAAVVAADVENVSSELKEATSQFTAKMFSEVAKLNPDKSIVLSPFSVLQPLAQLSLASVGESHDEILRVMGLPNDNVTKQVFAPLPQQLRSAKGIELKLANSIYVAEGFALNDEFAASSKDIFDSEIKQANFLNGQKAASEINTWIEEKTNHRIKDMVKADSFNQNTRVVLVNAIYFKGSWAKKFDKGSTTDKDFHVTKEKTVSVPSMYKRDELLYRESEELNARVLRLPYEGDEASFYIFLPNEIDGISSLEDKLKDPLAVSKATQKLHKWTVDLTLPKFKIETTTDLREVLTKVGAGKMFDSVQAKLDNLLKGPANLFVSEAIQKALIEVNEEGTVAAASNVFAVHTRRGTPVIEFNVDRPFYYVLMFKDIPLFCGVYSS